MLEDKFTEEYIKSIRNQTRPFIEFMCKRFGVPVEVIIRDHRKNPYNYIRFVIIHYLYKELDLNQEEVTIALYRKERTIVVYAEKRYRSASSIQVIYDNKLHSYKEKGEKYWQEWRGLSNIYGIDRSRANPDANSRVQIPGG